MMMQQVNLYVPELRPKKEWLTAGTIFSSALGFALLMVFSTVMLKQELTRYEQNLELMEAQRIEVEARIERFKNMPRIASEFQMEQRLAELRLAIENHENIGKIIQGQNLGNEAGFSQSMTAFSRQALPSIAIEHIRISRGGKFIELKGLARNGQDIPKYVQLLKTEASLHEAQFGLLTLNENRQQTGTHQFSYGFEALYPMQSGASRR